MKLIHLSDLHIGKRLDSFSLMRDQEHILMRILDVIDAERADAVLICGDVYDKSVPSAEAVTLVDEFLCSLAKRGVPVLMISGNHDSPERLAFGGRLFESSGVHISPVYSGRVEPITLSDGHGEVSFWLLPFIRPAHVRRYYPESDTESFTGAVRTAIANMAVDTARRNVLLTHQFVTGAKTCDSEEMWIGGSDNVDASVFEAFDYVALGHLHGPQNIGSGRIRYCGTPLKYSFSEAGHYKSVTVAELGKKGELEIRTVPLMPLHDLAVLRTTFGELTEQPQRFAAHRQDYLHIVLTDEEDVPEAVGRLRQIYNNLVKLSYDNTRTRADSVVGSAEMIRRKSPLELFEELYMAQNNRPMSEEQRAFTLELIEQIREEGV